MYLRLVVVTLLLILAACSPPDLPYTLADLPAGDAGNGEKIFLQSHNEAPPCSTCHSTDGSSDGVGPELSGYGAVAGERVNGQSAEEYSFNSITRPGLFLVQGFSNLMYNDYAKALGPTETADLIAYILTL
jgi:mono/diheme cytochrome c family protein